MAPSTQTFVFIVIAAAISIAKSADDSYWLSKERLGEQQLKDIVDLQVQLWSSAKAVNGSKLRVLCNQSRHFGVERDPGKATKGHEATLLHTVLMQKPGLVATLRKLIAHKKGDFNIMHTLQIRTVESLTYHGHAPQRGGGGGGVDVDGLGWHDDFGSFLTMVVMLSRLEDYRGGAFEIDTGAEVKSMRLDRGDVMVWKSWLPHRVAPVTGGKRHVLVVEWWNEAEQLGAELVHRMSAPPNPKKYCLQVAHAAQGLYDFNTCWGYNAPEQVQELMRKFKV